MKTLLDSFDSAARKQVNDAIVNAEARTAAEVLPVVAPRSGAYERAEDVVGLWTGILVMGVVWLVFQGVSESGDWAGNPVVRVGYWTLVLLLLAGFVGGIVLANRFSGIQRLFTPRREIENAVISRAKAIFFDRKLHRTSRSSGILLFVSLLERRVVVLVDEAVAEKLGENHLEEIRDKVLSGIRDKNLGDGLSQGIDRIGELLAESFPAGEERQNEINNEVVVLGS
jgi:putative membrane protein